MRVERPVALIHSYLADRSGKDRPDRLTRVGLLAASELYRRGEIDKICITVEPQLSTSQITRLKTLLNNPPEEDIVVDPKTVTTEQEIGVLGKLAEENGWGTLITVSNHSHLPRVERAIKKFFVGRKPIIEARSSEEILSNYPRYASILKEMEHWPEQGALNTQERLLNLPVLGSLVLRVGPHLKHLKVILQSWVFKRLESKDSAS